MSLRESYLNEQVRRVRQARQEIGVLTAGEHGVYEGLSRDCDGARRLFYRATCDGNPEVMAAVDISA